MTQNPSSNPEIEDKKKAFFEKAKRGLLLHLKQNKELPLSELHDFMLNKYLIQHQGFSRFMEELVAEKLLTYDFEKDVATLTESGVKYVESF